MDVLLSRENADYTSVALVTGPITPAGSTADIVGPVAPLPVIFG